MTTIITCGHTRAGLAATRALGRRGNAVAVGAPVRPCLAMWSRYASSTFLVPDAALAARSFVDRIGDEAAGRHATMALASTDAARWALSRWRDALSAGAQRVLPPHAAVARALDREALHDRARAAGVRPLESVRVNGVEDLEAAYAALSKRGDTAVLVRSRVPWVEREDGGRNVFETVPATGVTALRALFAARPQLVERGCLLEPRPPGRWLAYGTVVDDGVPLVEVFQERLREREDLSGVSTLARTIAPDDALRAHSRTVLDALSWQGPALVEWYVGADGQLQLVDVIGRLWGSVQLAIQAGADIPAFCLDVALGRTRRDVCAIAEPGHLWRWMVGDLEVMFGRARSLLATRRSVGARSGFVTRLQRLLGHFKIDDLLHAEPDVFDLDDPLPVVLEVEHRLAERARAAQVATSA